MKYVILFFLTGLLLLSCRKDPGHKGCKHSKSAPGILSMGNADGMQYNQLNATVQGGYYQPKSCLIDVENDNTPDFEIIHEITGSPAIGAHPYASIKCLNGSSIGIDVGHDTTYYYLTTTYFGSNPVQESIKARHSCIAPPVIDSIVSIGNRTAYRHESEKFSMSNSWTSSAQSLISYSYGLPSGPMNATPDTITYFGQLYERECHNPTGSIYLPIKKLRCGEMKLGWIKLTFPDGWWSVTIDEVAIQR